MKKFLSICLVALCGVSAMYAQTESTASEDTEKTRTGVECGSKVTVSATSVNKHFNFDHWEIQKTDGSSITSIQPNTTNSTYNATSSLTTEDSEGKETNVLTVDPLNHSLIDLVNTPGVTGTITFKAFFTEENWYIINATTNDESLGFVSKDPTDGKVYHDESVTLTATPDDDCIAFDHWEDENGKTISGNADNPKQLTVKPDPNWANQSQHTYKAVFAKKKVNVKVTTSDNKGTVTLTVTPPAANPQ